MDVDAWMCLGVDVYGHVFFFLAGAVDAPFMKKKKALILKRSLGEGSRSANLAICEEIASSGIPTRTTRSTYFKKKRFSKCLSRVF